MFRSPDAIKAQLLGKDDFFHQLAIGRCRHRLASRRATIYPEREAQQVAFILYCHLSRLTLSVIFNGITHIILSMRSELYHLISQLSVKKRCIAR
jgi:hypothetical protein